MRAFRFGAQLGAATGEEWHRQLASAQDLGYSIVTLADHFGGRLAPLTALAAAADRVELRLGTLVLANDFRHPAVLAKEIASLDQLSGGRCELGIGAGWLADDYRSSGIPMETPGEALEGLTGKGYAVCPDRREALCLAVSLLGEGDLLLAAGKGHEDYQIIGRQRIHFDDREELRLALSRKESL